MMSQTWRLLLVGWLVLSPLILSCASAQSPAPSPTPTAAEAKPFDNSYIIGPGDTLKVFVWRNPELTATVPVRPDGKISTPLVENMVAVGKTPPQLARGEGAVRASAGAESQHHRRGRPGRS